MIGWTCPVSGAPLDDDLASPEGTVYPTIAGVPVLVPDPERFLARHGPAWSPLDAMPTRTVEPLPVDAPDPVTPHLSPRQLADLAPAPLSRWLGTLTDDPNDVCARFAARFAPPGPAVDLGCGVGVMARRMATSRREVVAMDISPRAVLLARALLLGRIPDPGIPTSRGGVATLRWPHPPIRPDIIAFAVASATDPPLPVGAAAWVHLGNLVDIASDGMFDVLRAAASLLAPGGLLTISTPYDTDAAPSTNAAAPATELRACLADLELPVVAERDPVPWVVREYDRGWRIWLCDCLAARRA